ETNNNTCNQTSCADIDECTSSPCSPSGTCINTVGSFSCTSNISSTAATTISATLQTSTAGVINGTSTSASLKNKTAVTTTLHATSTTSDSTTNATYQTSTVGITSNTSKTTITDAVKYTPTSTTAQDKLDITSQASTITASSALTTTSITTVLATTIMAIKNSTFSDTTPSSTLSKTTPSISTTIVTTNSAMSDMTPSTLTTTVTTNSTMSDTTPPTSTTTTTTKSTISSTTPSTSTTTMATKKSTLSDTTPSITVTTKSTMSNTTPPTSTSTTTTKSTFSDTTPSTSTVLMLYLIFFSAVRLFPYGPKVNDTDIRTELTDYTSRLITPKIEIPFGSKLHKSLYFTDNGQILFPDSDNDVFNYTNPPESGFTENFPVAMIAVSWDDSDLSAGVGTIFYQEYLTLNSKKNNLNERVESMISEYLNNSYTAKWTLKVTWDNVPAYKAEASTTKTNTYQAILTTNGNETYVLMLFKDNGMNWDVQTKAATNLLMGFHSGDGWFKNDDHIKRTPAEKYRPDKYSGLTSGNIRGLWIYKVTRGTPQVNYKLKCLEWFNLEPEPSSWNDGLLSCPCTYQQGRRDLRFSRLKNGTLKKKLVSFLRWPFHIATCFYNDNGAFVEGYQCQGYAPIEFDIQPFNWCCRKINNPEFCEDYAKKRPKIECSDYIPPTNGWMLGDPHIATLDGKSYTFNGLGDFILLKTTGTSTSFMLQGRTVQTGEAMATNFEAFVASFTSNVTNTNTVQWILKNNNSIDVLLNNKNVSFTFSIGHPDMDTEIYQDNHILIENNGSVSATFEGKISVTVSASFGILSIYIGLSDEYFNKTEGLLGVWNSNPNDDFRNADGITIPINSSDSDIYKFGITWEVTNSSLFTSNFASRTAPTTKRTSFMPMFLDDLKSENKTFYNSVAQFCENNKECIYDVLSTKNFDIGKQTKNTNADFQETNKILHSFPPNITGRSVFMTRISEQLKEQYIAVDSDGKVAYFTTYTSPEINVTANGTLIWKPTLTPLSIELEANGSNGLISVFKPRFIVCNCASSSKCIYEVITRVQDSSLYTAACECATGFSGSTCQTRVISCRNTTCFPGVSCKNESSCGPCPVGYTGDGLRC
uniref:Mucin-4 n=1 Tax=Latimeria chalumnae TaxID=7897 RepID=H2ZYL8_LATCH